MELSRITLLLWLARLYIAGAIVMWPLTTLISTAYALKLKIPPLPRIRLGAVAPRVPVADS